MMEVLNQIYSELKSLRKDIKSVTVKAISKKPLLSRTESLGLRWFSEVSDNLEIYGLSEELINKYSKNFSRLIKISAPNNLKSSYLKTLDELANNFRDDLIIPVQKKPNLSVDKSLFSQLLSGLLDPKESEYLEEALNCAQHKYYRAAVVLGWCAAIDRIHRTIDNIGYKKFNATSASMKSKTHGRFKKFTKIQNVSSLSELREVFDNIILWIIEGMELIDTNQHTRLKGCFDLRCHCAHPGDAPVTEYNLLSFFSDINEIIFKNPKFQC